MSNSIVRVGNNEVDPGKHSIKSNAMKCSPTASSLLSNLHLLDLPPLDDGPITPQTFTSGVNKSKAFEHIIHHLLHLYDPKECKTRFAGNWPVYEPPQSKNLRASVVAWLGDLKKSGALTSGVIIRKSVFDDCQGDRYEELMLALSCLVLKSLRGRKGSQSIVYREAVTPYPVSDVVQPLLTAYESSLQNKLMQQSALKEEWQQLARFIEQSEQGSIDVRKATESMAATSPNLKMKERAIEDAWRKNWLGNEAFFDIISFGKQRSFEDASTFEHFKQKKKTTGQDITPLDKLEAQRILQAARYSTWKAKLTAPLDGSQPTLRGRTISNYEGPSIISLGKHQKIYPGLDQADSGSPSDAAVYNDLGDVLRRLEGQLNSISTSRRAIGERPKLTAPRSYDSNSNVSDTAFVLPDNHLVSRYMLSELTDETTNQTIIETQLKSGFIAANESSSEPRETLYVIPDESIYDDRNELVPKPEVESTNETHIGSHDDSVLVKSEDEEKFTAEMTMEDIDLSDDEELSECELTIAQLSPTKADAPALTLSTYAQDFIDDTRDNTSAFEAMNEDSFDVDQIVSSVANAAYTPMLSRASKETRAAPNLIEANINKTPEDIFTSDDYGSVFKSRPKIAFSPPSFALSQDESIADDKQGESFSFDSPLKKYS